MKRTAFTFVLGFAALSASAQDTIRITEYLYTGNSDEYVEFTNVGAIAVDMTGWSYDDDSQVPGTTDLSAFGVVQPGESVIMSEGTVANFQIDWNVPLTLKIVGNNTANLGRNDEINLFDAMGVLHDRLTFGDQDFPGTIRANEIAGWPCAEVVGQNAIHGWVLSEIGDAQGSYMSLLGDVGNPGVYVETPCPDSARLNEIYANDTGTDDLEYIELTGVPFSSLDDHVVLVVEGDGAGAGTLDRAYDLTGNVFPVDGYFVLGDMAEAEADFVIGTTNALENGTNTFYVVRANNAGDLAALVGLVGQNVTTGLDTTMIGGLGVILDRVAIIDGGAINGGGDVTYDGAPRVGPDLESFAPAGAYRGEDHPNGWCDAYLDIDDALNEAQPRTPGAFNSPCYVRNYGNGCIGSGGFTPRLQIAGSTAPSGSIDLNIYHGLGGTLAYLFLSATEANVPFGSCDLLVGPSPLITIVLPLAGANPGEGKLEVSVTVPPAAPAATLYMQVFTVDAGAVDGYAGSHGVETIFTGP